MLFRSAAAIDTAGAVDAGVVDEVDEAVEAVAGAGTSIRCSRASKTVSHCPQRTRPWRSRSWSATSRNAVRQAGQRVTSLAAAMVTGQERLAVNGRVPCRQTQPSSLRQTDMASHGA